MNVNVWKFFTYIFELERDLSSAYAERLALLPSKSWFRTEGYGLLAPGIYFFVLLLSFIEFERIFELQILIFDGPEAEVAVTATSSQLQRHRK